MASTTVTSLWHCAQDIHGRQEFQPKEKNNSTTTRIRTTRSAIDTYSMLFPNHPHPSSPTTPSSHHPPPPFPERRPQGEKKKKMRRRRRKKKRKKEREKQRPADKLETKGAGIFSAGNDINLGERPSSCSLRCTGNMSLGVQLTNIYHWFRH